ncbi:MAG TPA: hypothetical protein VJN19_02335 [Propionibacteriaceae bacterium]|nr:hypothetical protein [Propionibacteriaceae bacterium]
MTEADEIVDDSLQDASDSQRSRLDAERRARIRELEEELERYRQASEDALQQLDWCIGYMHGSNKLRIAKALARNRAFIRTNLMKRPEEPVPTQQIEER